MLCEPKVVGFVQMGSLFTLWLEQKLTSTWYQTLWNTGEKLGQELKNLHSVSCYKIMCFLNLLAYNSCTVGYIVTFTYVLTISFLINITNEDFQQSQVIHIKVYYSGLTDTIYQNNSGKSTVLIYSSVHTKKLHTSNVCTSLYMLTSCNASFALYYLAYPISDVCFTLVWN
jgi:hypothetical protein